MPRNGNNEYIILCHIAEPHLLSMVAVHIMSGLKLFRGLRGPSPVAGSKNCAGDRKFHSCLLAVVDGVVTNANVFK